MLNFFLLNYKVNNFLKQQHLPWRLPLLQIVTIQNLSQEQKNYIIPEQEKGQRQRPEAQDKNHVKDMRVQRYKLSISTEYGYNQFRSVIVTLNQLFLVTDVDHCQYTVTQKSGKSGLHNYWTIVFVLLLCIVLKCNPNFIPSE